MPKEDEFVTARDVVDVLVELVQQEIATDRVRREASQPDVESAALVFARTESIPKLRKLF